MAPCGAPPAQWVKTHRLSLLAMPSDEFHKKHVREFIRRSSLTNVKVLDLTTMHACSRVEFLAGMDKLDLDNENLLTTIVGGVGFKSVIYECFQASLDVTIGGCKVIIRSSGTGLFADVVSRFEQAYLNMIELDGMDGDGERAVLHVEQFSLHGRIPSGLNRILHDAVRWQIMPATVHDPPTATNFFDEALDIDEGTSCTLLALRHELVDRAVADVVPRIPEPTQLGFRMEKPDIDATDRIKPRHSDVVQWLQPKAPPTVAPPASSAAVAPAPPTVAPPEPSDEVEPAVASDASSSKAVKMEYARRRSKSPAAHWMGPDTSSVVDLAAFAESPQPKREPRPSSRSRPSVGPPSVATQRYIDVAQPASSAEPMMPYVAPVPNPQGPYVQADSVTVEQTAGNPWAIYSANIDAPQPVMSNRGRSSSHGNRGRSESRGTRRVSIQLEPQTTVPRASRDPTTGDCSHCVPA